MIWMILKVYLCQIFITALSTCAVPTLRPISGNITENLYFERSINLISEVAIKMASAYDIAFHYDDSNGNVMDAIGRQIGIYNRSKTSYLHRTNKFHYSAKNVVFILKNYINELHIETPLIDYKHTRNILHIVFLDETKYFVNALSRKFKKYDIILFICYNVNKKQMSCSKQYDKDQSSLNASLFLNTSTLLQRLNLVMVLEITRDILRIFEICFFCGTQSKKMTLKYEAQINNMNENVSLIFVKTIMKEAEFNYKDFNEHTLRIAFPHGSIYMGCFNEVNTEIGDDIYTECPDMGIEAKMINEISNRMNFKYKLVNPKLQMVEGSQWRNMLNNVFVSKVDVAIGAILISQSRQLKFDFTFAVGEDPLKIVYMTQENILHEAFMIALVFTSRTWTTLLATIIILCGLMYVSDRYLYRNHLAVFRYAWMVGSILVEQAIKDSAAPGRRLLGSWIMCSIIICTIYKAKLTSILANPPIKPLETLSHLVGLDYNAYFYDIDPKLVHDAIEQILHPSTYEKISNRISETNDMCNILKQSLTSNTFLIQDMVPMQQFVIDCSQFMTPEELARIRVTRDKVPLSSHGWAVRKETPYLDYFNHYISLFEQNGLNTKWSENIFPSLRKETIDFDKGMLKNFEPQPIHLYGPFLFGIFGILISIACFIGEFFYSHFWDVKVLKPLKKKPLPGK